MQSRESFANSRSFVFHLSLTWIGMVLLLIVAAWAPPAAAQGWTTLPGAAMDVGGNANGVVWVIGTNPVPGGYTIWQWNNGNWQNVPGGALRVSVDTDGTAWVVNNTGNIFHSNPNAPWTTAPGTAMDIGVGANGAVWIIEPDQSIAQAIFAPGTRNVTSWQKIDGGAVRIAVGPDGNPWVVNAGGQIYQRQNGAWVQLAIGGARDISIGPDGTPYLVLGGSGAAGGQVFRLMPNPANAMIANPTTAWLPIPVGAGPATNVAAAAPGTIYVTEDSSKQYAIMSASGLPAGSAPSTAASNGSSSSTTTPAGLTAFDFCWRNTHGRGAGQPLSTNSSDCPAGTVKDPTGLLCYPPCKAGYNMIGPVCWQQCPSGFNDTGADCGKPSAYGRGAGYPWQIGDVPFNSGGQFSRCQSDNPQGCEQPGGGVTLVYPKCKANFHAVGTNICSPDCPAGMPDVGAMCQKNSYGNGVGQTLGCAPGLDKSGLLCYPSCGAHSDGVGPVCWDECPSGWVQCGAGCAKDSTACATDITNQVISVLAAAASIASEVLTAGATAGIIDASKTGTNEAIKAGEAADQAADMVGKLNLSEAVSKFPQHSIDSSAVTQAVTAAMKPTKLTVATKAVDVAGQASTLISTMVGISNSAGLTQDQKNFQIAQAVLNTASLVDPTGIAGVVAAYTKPLCSLVTQTATNDLNLDLNEVDKARVRQDLMGNW